MNSKEVKINKTSTRQEPTRFTREIRCKVTDVFAFRKKSVSVYKGKRKNKEKNMSQLSNKFRGGEGPKQKVLKPATTKARSQTVSIFNKRRSSTTQELMDRLKQENSVKTREFVLKPMPVRPLDDLKTRKTISNKASPRNANQRIRFNTISNKQRGTSTPHMEGREGMVNSNDMFLRYQQPKVHANKIVQSFPVKNRSNNNKQRKESNNTNTDEEEFDFGKFQKFEDIDDDLNDDFNFYLKNPEREEKKMMEREESYFRKEKDNCVFSFKNKERKTAVFNTLPDNIFRDEDDGPSFKKNTSDYFFNSVVVDSANFDRQLNELEESDKWFM